MFYIYSSFMFLWAHFILNALIYQKKKKKEVCFSNCSAFCFWPLESLKKKWRWEGERREVLEYDVSLKMKNVFFFPPSISQSTWSPGHDEIIVAKNTWFSERIPYLC